MSNQLKNRADNDAEVVSRKVSVQNLEELTEIRQGPSEEGVVSERLRWVQSRLTRMGVTYKEFDEEDGNDFYEPVTAAYFINDENKQVTLYVAPVGQVVDDEGFGFYTFERASSAAMGVELARGFKERSDEGVNAVVLFMDGQSFDMAAYQIKALINFKRLGNKVGRVVELGPFAGPNVRVNSGYEELYGEVQNAVIGKGLRTQKHDWGSEIAPILEDLGIEALLVDSFRAVEPAMQWTDWYSQEDQIKFAATSDFDKLYEVMLQIGIQKE